jgi:hypothetical protein
MTGASTHSLQRLVEQGVAINGFGRIGRNDSCRPVDLVGRLR